MPILSKPALTTFALASAFYPGNSFTIGRSRYPPPAAVQSAVQLRQGMTATLENAQSQTVEKPQEASFAGSGALAAVTAGAALAARRLQRRQRCAATKRRQQPVTSRAEDAVLAALQAGNDSVPQKGNLVQYSDTWHIHKAGDEVPESAKWSDCSVEPSSSEYANDKDPGAKAWVSKSKISFDYRVVEVPRGHLLDPSCDALLFGHLQHGSPERAAAEAKPQRRLVVIDETVDSLYGARVRAYFEARGVEYDMLVLPMEEENKSMEMTMKVAKKMKEFNIDRRTEPVLAIGGGVCLDVVGLAGALFRRRTPYIRVPTTALSYVDASVGAKSGVNFAGSKNRLGMYVPPAAALLDASFFVTQERREVANGIAEMAKMAIMKSEELFCLLEENAPRMVADKFMPCDDNDGVPARILQLSIETMLEELAPNLWEHSLDRLVDFGHAVGQDLEMAALGTEHELMHGESVANDMALMTCLAYQLGFLSTTERDRTLNMLRRCQVPVWSPVFTYKLFSEAVANRVKNSMGQKLPLPIGLGRARIVNDVSDADLKAAWEMWCDLCGEQGAGEPTEVAAQSFARQLSDA